MAFQSVPHHILSPQHGWLTPDIIAQHPEACDCRLNLSELVTEEFVGGEPDWTNPHEPEKGWPHSHELDCSTSLTGYTRLSEEHYAIREWISLWSQIRSYLIRRQQAENAEARLKLIRDRAAQDPAYAALAKQLGIPI